MSVASSSLPSAVEVGGRPVCINTTHACGLRVAAILDDPSVDDRTAMAAVVANYFSAADRAGADPGELYGAAMTFFFCGKAPGGKPGKAGKPGSARIWDWEADADLLVADFQRFYGIDLTDAGKPVHWWRFMALYRGLGDTSATMRVKDIRSRRLSDCSSAEERARLRDAKRAVALPPRTAAEVEPEDI